MTSPHKKSFAAEQLRQQQKKSPVVWVLVCAVVVMLIIGCYILYRRSVVQKQVDMRVQKIKSIAVLPFVDMSPEKDQQYLGDGIADYIINKLAQIEDLHIIDRTSSFQFRDREDAIDEIGEKLHVDAVLEGSIIKSGDRFRVTAQLIKISDHSHLFSKSYDTEFREILAIQDEISHALAIQVKGTLKEHEVQSLAKRYTNDVETYNLIMQGLDGYYGGKGIDKYLPYFRMAAARDPDCAIALGVIAHLYTYGGKADSAKILADRALAIDNTLADPHFALARISIHEFDFSAAENAYKRALTFNPGSAEARFFYAQFLRSMGRYEEALEEALRGLELNPLLPGEYAMVIATYNNLDRFEDAREVFRTADDLFPNNGYICSHMGRFYYKRGDYEKALEVLRQGNRTLHIGITYGLMGEREKAKQILDELEKTGKEPPERLAYLYIGLGDYDRAFELLEYAVDVNNVRLSNLICDFEYDPIRSDPRFKALLKKMGLPED